MSVQSPFESADIVAHISSYGKASGALSVHDTRETMRICEIATFVMIQATARLVTAVDHEPLMQSCSADGTPIQVGNQVQAHLPNNQLIGRGGHTSHEFLVANQFTCFYHNGKHMPYSLLSSRFSSAY